MNSENKKNRFSFNVIDVIITVIALVSIVMLIFFLNKRSIITPRKEETADIEYTVVISPLREEFRNLVEIGDKVINADIMESVGEIANVSYSEYLYEGINKVTGQKEYTPYPGMITMTLTIKCKAVVTDSGYKIHGYDIVIGDTFTVRVPRFNGIGVCTSINTGAN